MKTKTCVSDIFDTKFVSALNIKASIADFHETSGVHSKVYFKFKQKAIEANQNSGYQSSHSQADSKFSFYFQRTSDTAVISENEKYSTISSNRNDHKKKLPFDMKRAIEARVSVWNRLKICKLIEIVLSYCIIDIEMMFQLF